MDAGEPGDSGKESARPEPPISGYKEAMPGSLYPARLLLDEHCARYRSHLTNCGWDVRTTLELGLGEKTPQEIIMFARRNNALLITMSKLLESVAEENGARCISIRQALASSIQNFLREEKLMVVGNEERPESLS